MIILRDQQVEAFEDAHVQSFEDRLFPHIRREFPEQVRDLGETETREVICSGGEVAAGYGIESEQDVGQYIMLMVVHDFDFDSCSDALGQRDSHPARPHAFRTVGRSLGMHHR